MLELLKKLLPFVFVCLMPMSLKAAADSDTNRFEHYKKQYTKLHDNYMLSPNDVANIAALAYFYSEADNPMRNLPLAMDYIQVSEIKYKELISDKNRYREVNKLIKKGFTIVELRKRRQMIVDEARKYVKNGIGPDEADAFLHAFGNDKVIQKEISQQKSLYYYNNALELNTEKAYKDYLDNPLNTYDRETIIDKLKDLLKRKITVATTEKAVDEVVELYDYPEIKQLAESRKYEINYQKTIAANTTEAYISFLRRYPSSDKYDLILDALDTLTYNEFKLLKTPRQYADFALKYSELPPSEHAIDSLVRMIIEKQDNEALRIYLSEFKNDIHYNDVYKAYYQRFACEGNAAPIRIFERDNPEFPLKFLITEDLKKAEEIDKIPLLTLFDEATTNKNGDWLKKYMGKNINYVILQRLLQPYTSKENWKGALDFMSKYEICFENSQEIYFKQLRKILSENVKEKATLVYNPRYNVSHPQITTSGTIYANKVSNFTTQVVAISKHNGKMEEETILFDTATGAGITFFSLSDDEKTMLVGKKGDIFFAQKQGLSTWKLSDIGAKGLNTDTHYEGDATLTPDGMGILFVSDRPDGCNINPSGSLYHGDTALATDIYYIPRTKNGWGTPINLGPVVNSAFCERSPVLSRDMTTLYFTSDRNGGMGYQDIYMTTRVNTNSWTEWTSPVNIGKTANTSFSEPTLSLSPDENLIYYTSNSPSMQRYSLYSCKTKHVKGSFYRTAKINCQKTADKAQNISIDVFDLRSMLKIHHYRVSDSIKTFNFDVFATKSYIIHCQSKGCFIPIMHMYGEKTTFAPHAYEIKSAVSQKKHIPLSAIYFEENTAELKPISDFELQNIVNMLQENPNIKIEIINNVTGNDVKKAYELSLSRSEAIKKAIVRHNINPNRVVASGFGNVNYKKHTSVKSVEIIFFED